MSHEALFKQLIGKWEGPCRTWFEPDKLADESKVVGEFTAVFGGRFVRYTYEGTIQKKPRGDYDVGDHPPKWGWRTEYEFVDDDHLTITAYNITPSGPEAKGVETCYHRVK